MTTNTAFELAQNDIRPGWEERYAQFSEEDVIVTINYDKTKFTPEEQLRNEIKLRIIADYARELVHSNFKGTYKYLHDDRTPEEWKKFEDDEQRDLVNYMLLRRMSEKKREADPI